MEYAGVPLFEVQLIRDDERETRLTDHALEVGETVAFGEQRWFVVSEAEAERPDAAARYVCVPADEAT